MRGLVADPYDGGPAERVGTAAAQRQVIAAERGAGELEAAGERIVVYLLGPRQVAQLQLEGARHVDARLVRLGLDQQPAASRIAEVQHQVDVDRFGQRFGDPVDEHERRQHVQAVQQVDQRLVAGHVLVGALHPFVQFVGAERPERIVAAAAAFAALVHLLEYLQAPVLDPAVAVEPVDRLVVAGQREWPAIARIGRRGRQTGVGFDELDQRGVQRQHQPVLVAVDVGLRQPLPPDARPVHRAAEEAARQLAAQQRDWHPHPVERLDQIADLQHVRLGPARLLVAAAQEQWNRVVVELRLRVVDAPLARHRRVLADVEAEVEELHTGAGDHRHDVGVAHQLVQRHGGFLESVRRGLSGARRARFRSVRRGGRGTSDPG